MTTSVNIRYAIAGHAAAAWTGSNPVLLERELAVEIDTGKAKLGDGTTAWNSLGYQSFWSAWGRIGGTLTDQTDLVAALGGKEPTIAVGTTGQYWRGDKSWQTLDKAAVGLSNLSNSVTGSGNVVLATSPALTTPSVTTSLSLGSASSANFLFSANSAAVAGRVQIDTGGNMVFRNETSGGLFFDAFNGTITFRNYGSGSATLFRIGTADVRAGADNTINLGTASFRWKEVFAGNATINTSDERLKHWLGGLTPAQLRAGLRIADEIGLFRWLDGSRVHVGVRAQQVARILIEEGVETAQPLDFAPDVFVAEADRPSFRMAFLTFDTWEAVREPVMREKCIKRATRKSPAVRDSVQRIATRSYRPKAGEVIDADGLVWRERKAGNVFGIRTGELTLFLAACEAAERRRMAAILDSLTP